MAKIFSNFRLLTTPSHPLGASALMDITNHGSTHTVRIKQHRSSKKWYYSSGIQKELPSSVLGQLGIPDDLSKPFWWQDSDKDLHDSLRSLAHTIEALHLKLDQNEKDFYDLRRRNGSDLAARSNDLLSQRDMLRGVIRELAGSMVTTDLIS